MKLFTKDINQKLFAQYRIGSNLNKQNVVAKIFNPYGRGRWYLLNSDPNDPDYLWAIVQMDDEVEIGSVSRSELESIRIKPYNLPLERDMYFSERNAMEVLDGLEKGQTFARGGMVAGRWYKDNSGKEFRYIGESQGKLLFNDGTKIVEKDENDFEEEPTKERKLFGLFKDGGIIKGRNNETGESFGVVIGSIKKSDEYVEGGNEMNVRISYSSRMGENKLVFDSNGNLFGIMFYPYVMDGFPDTSYGSFHTYNADKKETIKVLSDMYSPAFAKRLIELAKGNKMEEGGETSEMKEDFLEDIKETHGAIKEITLEDGSKVSRKEMMAAHHNLKQAKYGSYLEKGGYVAVSEKDGYWYIMSKPSTKEKAEQMIALGVPKGEVGKVVTLKEAKEHKKLIGKEYLEKGGAVKDFKVNFKLNPKTLNLHLGRYGDYDYANRRVKNWNVDDFKSYVWDYSTDDFEISGTSSKSSLLLKEIFVNGKLPVENGELVPTGANNDEYYKKYKSSGSVMYDVWAEIIKQNNLTPSDENELIKEPKPKLTKDEEKELKDFEDLQKNTPFEILISKDSPVTDEMYDRNRELANKANLILAHEGKPTKYKKGGYMAKGGKAKFDDKVKAIEKSLLKRKKVSPSVQKDYGKTYNKKEAHESAQRIVGARVAKYEFLKNLKKGKK